MEAQKNVPACFFCIAEPQPVLCSSGALPLATEIGNSTGISDRTARKHIALLRTRGIIRRHGSNKTGYWELTEDI